MTLHEAIVKLLKEKGRAMTLSEIADAININKWYTKRDSSLITPFQIHGRTLNYSHLFRRQGSLVALIDQSFEGVERQIRTKKPPPKKATSKAVTSFTSLANKLMDKSNFKSAGKVDSEVPENPGLYCIRIKSPSALPEVFEKELRQREHNIIYIGKASRSLNRRFLNQELRARGHGTFFRSIGCVLGYKPPKGSLVNKKNKNNFKFRPEDEIKIIRWINENLIVNWIEYDREVIAIESGLILRYKPLLNLDGNPYALVRLRTLRSVCKQIANSEN